MIGAFARKLAAHTDAQRTDYEKLSDANVGAPPERFVERIPHEGGDVIFTPLVETLLVVLKRRTLPASHEDLQAPSDPERRP